MGYDLCYFVYILASKRNGTLYTGFTGFMVKRIAEHKLDLREGFTKKYGVHLLVWFEQHFDVHNAIAREKQIKGWNRAWKIKLIEKLNPGWIDLYPRFLAADGYDAAAFESQTPTSKSVVIPGEPLPRRL